MRGIHETGILPRSLGQATLTAAALLALALPMTGQAAATNVDGLRTVAESSDWKATGRHQDVMSFLKRLATAFPQATLTSMGTSGEGRDIPLLVLADPPVRTPQEARASGKLVVYAQGGIHSGECCGKEALQMLARDLLSGEDVKLKLLDHLILLIAPIYNPDGNERMAKDNRPGQNGPEEGMGIRANGAGLDLNRDNIKLESPEARGLARLLNVWDPYVAIDTHTTNGSYHRYTLTFDGAVNPAGDARIIDFTRGVLLPSISDRVFRETGYKTTFYGNPDRKKTSWYTYDGVPRFGTRERGIRGIVTILTEAYKYAPYKDRILCTKAFVKEILRYADEHRERIRALVEGARRDAIMGGRCPQAWDQVALRTEIAPLPAPIHIEGWVEKSPPGAKGPDARPRPTKEKKTYVMEHWGAYRPTLSTPRPYAYAYSARWKTVTEKLRQHGIVVERADAPFEVPVQVQRILRVDRQRRAFQGHKLVSVETEQRREIQAFRRETMVVRTAQPLGNLIVYLLEPRSEDGLVTWGFFDDALVPGRDFPVVRIPQAFRYGMLRDKDGWTPLFDGKSFDGWTPKIRGQRLGEDPWNTFRVRDGVIQVGYEDYERFEGRFGHLFYDLPFSDYVLEMEYRFTGKQAPGGPGWAIRNSGIMIHGQSPDSMALNQDFPVSVEVQLLGGDGSRPRPTGNVCTPGTHIEKNGKLIRRHCIDSTSATFSGDQWVRVRVEVHGGRRIRHFINDSLVFEYSRPQLDPKDTEAKGLLERRRGHRMLTAGSISLQSESHPCEFRNIRIRLL